MNGSVLDLARHPAQVSAPPAPAPVAGRGGLRYDVLGPLRVVDDAAASFISARKMEILLAALIVRADQVVPIEALISEVWGEHPPRRATAALHVYVSQLRKFLARPGRPSGPILTKPPGYLFRMGDDTLDVHEFQALVHQGRSFSRTRRHDEASVCFQAALALWRGPALSDLRDGSIVNGFATWAEEARLECIELLIESDLALGRHREHVARLYALTTEFPLREVFYRQLMLALYRAERQADALKVFQTARIILRDDLGVEPCRALTDLYRAILVGDEQLDRPAETADRGGWR